MKFLVIGLGSMGKRRINLLLKHFDDITVCGVDTNEERRSQVQELFKINTYADLNKAISEEKPFAVLVCVSPAYHADIILKCIKNRLHVFCEINLLQNKYDEIMTTAELYKVKLFLSSTLLYRKEIEIIKDYVLKQKSKVNYKYHVGQYLPDWHPWEDYKNFFVGEKRTNACREIFAIELPWIIQTFGKVKSFTVLKDNISNLEIDFPDNYFVLLEHESGNKGILIVDIVSRKAERDLLVYSENLHLMWNGTPDSLSKYDINKKKIEKIQTYSNVEKDERYAESIIENEYLDELTVFIDKITDKQNKERYTFEDDKYTLQLIDRIEGIKA